MIAFAYTNGILAMPQAQTPSGAPRAKEDMPMPDQRLRLHPAQ